MMAREHEPVAGILGVSASVREGRRPHGSVARPSYVWPCAASLGLYIIAMLLAQAGKTPALLAPLQGGQPLVTGVLLGAATCMQWLLWRTRSGGGSAKARSMLLLHTWLGSLMPLLLVLHAPRLGRGALLALSLVFAGNLAVGLVNPTVMRPETKVLRSIWLVVHVGLSLLTIPLLAIHVWTRLRFWAD
jgi:hypothetical protein